MSATANFLKAFRSKQARPVLLARVDLATPSALSLYLSNTDIDTPDGQHWTQAIMSTDPLRAPGDYLSSGPDLASGGLVLDRRQLDSGTGTGDLQKLLSAYTWSGAAVTLYIWEQGLTSFTDAFQMPGFVVDTYESDMTTIHLYLLQSATWSKRLPTKILNPNDYPAAPAEVLGVPIPVLYGDFSLPDLRAPWPTADATSRQAAYDLGRQMLDSPGLVIDKGLGANPLKLLFAAHACYAPGGLGTDGSTELGIAAAGGQLLSRVDSSSFTVANDSNGYGVTLADDTMRAFAAVLPTDVRATGPSVNSATDARNAFDTSEITFASMNSDAANKVLELVLPNPLNLGAIVSVEGVVGYSTSSTTAGKNLRLYPLIPGGASGTTITLTPSATANVPKIVRGTWDAGYYHGNWQFGSVDSVGTVDLIVDFGVGVTGQTAKIFFVGLVVKYVPIQSLITAAVIGRLPPLANPNTRFFAPPNQLVSYLGRQGQVAPAVYELDTGVSANLYGGYTDDGSGTYTGTANALIKLTPDIMRHLLATFGSVAGASMETGASTFGSFVDARTYLKTMENTDFTQILRISTVQSVADVLRTMTAESLAQVIIDVTDGKFKILPWRRAQAADYDISISLDEALGAQDWLRVKPVSTVGVAQDIAVAYGISPTTGGPKWTANVAPEHSDQGFVPGLAGDQLLKVSTGVNDVLKFSQGGVNKTATFAAGTYLGIDMAKQVRDAMNTGGGVSDWYAGWGFAVKTGFNDTVNFSVDGGTTTLSPTIAAFSYTPEACCAAVQKAMNAAQTSRVFSVTYSRSTGKVTVSATGGTFILYFAGMGPTLGFTADSGAVTTATGSSVRKMEQFFIYRSGTNVAQWTNGATTCATLLGFDNSADYTFSAGGATNNAAYRRGDRQTRGDTNRTLYGDARPVSVGASTLRDTATAADLRDRLFDFHSAPRVKVEFTTHRCPDLQRGRVIQFNSSLDSAIPFPRAGSDGSWAGKVFRVTEVVRHLGPQWHQEVVAWEIDPVVTG